MNSPARKIFDLIAAIDAAFPAHKELRQWPVFQRTQELRQYGIGAHPLLRDASTASAFDKPKEGNTAAIRQPSLNSDQLEAKLRRQTTFRKAVFYALKKLNPSKDDARRQVIEYFQTGKAELLGIAGVADGDEVKWWDSKGKMQSATPRQLREAIADFYRES